jgi:molecular chaperone HtpG
MKDTYKDEILLRLQRSSLYLALKEKCFERDAEVIATIEGGIGYAYQRAKTVIIHMGEFTLHDGDHLFNVLELMELILGQENIGKLSAPELMLLILSAFFHDLGMSPTVHEVRLWQQAWDGHTNIFDGKEDQESLTDFQRFLLAREGDNQLIKALEEKGEAVRAATLKGYLISDYIRQTHAERAKQIIAYDPILGENRSNQIMYRRTNLTIELEKICYSHNDDPVALLELDKAKPCGQGIFACLPLVGLVLRLADLLDFDAKRTPAVLFSHLNIQHPVSLLEWQKHRSIEFWNIQPGRYEFSAKCEHPAIEAGLRTYCDYIDRELSAANKIMNLLNENLTVHARGIVIKLPPKVNRDRIEPSTDPEGNPLYIYRDTKFTLSKQQVVDLLMGTKLYGNPEVALRELLQNSLDACMARQALEKEWGNPYHPQVIVSLTEVDGEQILQVEDNGMGMDQEIIDKFYTKVGASFYKSAEFQQLLIDTHSDMKPRSRFGIGILSTFMVAETLEVDTMRITGPQKSTDAINMTVEGQDSLFWIRRGIRKSVGTTTKLVLRKQSHPWKKMTTGQFIESVTTVIPNPPYPVVIQAGDTVVTRDTQSFLALKPAVLDKSKWPPTENVRYLEFGFTWMGMQGSCILATVEDSQGPVFELTLPGKIVQVEGKDFPLSKFYKMEENQISIRGTSIGLDKQGEVKTEVNFGEWIESASSLSLHGILVPAELFPKSWNLHHNQVRLAWPFPLRILVDVTSPLDLDLNSARSAILKTEKWITFEEQLAFCVAFGIKSKVGDTFWDQFINNIIVPCDSAVLRKGFELVNDLASESDHPAIFDLPKSPAEDKVNDIDIVPF